MKTILVLGLSVLLTQLIVAQSPNKYVLKADRPISEQIAARDQFLFPGFTEGTAIFKENIPAQAKFNYNFLLDEMQFLDQNNKRMAIANTDELVSVIIGTHTFIFLQKGFFEEILDGRIKLLLKRHSSLIKEGRDAGYGGTTSTGAASSLDYISSSYGPIFNLSESAEYRLVVDSTYWITDGRKILNAGYLKSFKKILRKNNAEIDKFTSEIPVDLKKEADKKKLVEFCNALVK